MSEMRDVFSSSAASKGRTALYLDVLWFGWYHTFHLHVDRMLVPDGLVRKGWRHQERERQGTVRVDWFTSEKWLTTQTKLGSRETHLYRKSIQDILYNFN